MNRRNTKRNGGGFLGTATDMVLPTGLNAGLATLGLIGLNEYAKTKKRTSRKQKGGDENVFDGRRRRQDGGASIAMNGFGGEGMSHNMEITCPEDKMPMFKVNSAQAGGRRRINKRGGANIAMNGFGGEGMSHNMEITCPDDKMPMFKVNSSAPAQAGGRRRRRQDGGASIDMSGFEDNTSHNMEIICPDDKMPMFKVNSSAPAPVPAQAGGRRRMNKRGGSVVDSAADLLFPAGLTSGATTLGLLLIDQVAKRGTAKKLVSSVKKTTRSAAAKVKTAVKKVVTRKAAKKPAAKKSKK